MDIVNILWMAKYTQQWSSNTKHGHSFFQMLYVLGGEGTLLFEDECIRLEQDKLYLCHPNRLHTLLYNEKKPVKLIDIKFSVNDSQLYKEMEKLPTCISSDNHIGVRSALNGVLNECINKDNHYRDMANSLFYIYLVGLLRELCGNKRMDNNDRIPGYFENTYKGVKLGELIEFIENNYDTIISVDDLSRKVSLNKSYLINLFRQAYGTTPLKYINSVRMAKAKELLTYTDLNITEISMMVGFQSIHYFSRFFKEKEACTPLEYRIRNKGTHFVDMNTITV